MTARHTVDSITSDELDQLYDVLDRIRHLHHPIGVVAAAEAGIAPDCAGCHRAWPCQTYNAAAIEATERQEQP